jgi:UDP:flavonoid glycosyltransferase YjiC (YdhE family)
VRIVFTPWGSLGDLHPYLAVAIEMKRRGHSALIATSEVYSDKVKGEGLQFHAVRPDLRPFLDHPQQFAALMDRFRGSEHIFRGVIMPALRDMFTDLRNGAAGYDLLVSHVAMCAAPIVAESLSLPWVSAALQPAVIWSATDPPYVPIFGHLPRRSPRMARLFFRFVRAATNRWMQPVYELRRELGLTIRGHPLFEGQFSPFGALALFSPFFAPTQPDWPPGMVACGFPFYDKLNAASSLLSPEIEDFLARGEPPIIFTLGSSAVHVPGNFYEVSFQAAQALGRRAILLAGPEFARRTHLRSIDRILVSDYAPYSQILPRGAATVHSGGVGTTAQALRAGKPQIVMPFSHDQPDNGDRVERLGVGKMISRRHYVPCRVTSELQTLLADNKAKDKACRLGSLIQAERGAAAAADALELFLNRQRMPARPAIA